MKLLVVILLGIVVCVSAQTFCDPASPMTSCRAANPQNNGEQTLRINGQQFSAYCHVDPIVNCGPGPWTMVMKVDGNKKNFNYDSTYWTDDKSYNMAGGKTFTDHQETKLPTFWGTEFSRVCVGMQKPGTSNIQWMGISMNSTRPSLQSVFTGDRLEANIPDKDWRNLLGSTEATLQRNCQRSGFNAICERAWGPRARIGIVANNEMDCYSCDSVIGIGIDAEYWQHYSAGNMCDYWCSNLEHTNDMRENFQATMSYVLVA
ncbi:predicted protein [Nematostella vectensis]|uniref:Uncharacterized protein n=1 Tax=Nematostella vectensis TaxID=45351 RepID=A7RPG7_NEMVE|nr:predicted protein [Nematostella vectensis]|eukprot:XP_001638746.1 predicted protein [Nematostella vectensis]